jgi:hypothetical protein
LTSHQTRIGDNTNRGKRSRINQSLHADEGERLEGDDYDDEVGGSDENRNDESTYLNIINEAQQLNQTMFG